MRVFKADGTRCTDPDPAMVMMAMFVRSADCVLDLGANVGLHTTMAARIVGPEGVVVSVEASNETVEVLKRNVSHRPWTPSVRVLHAAVFDVSGAGVRIPKHRTGDNTVIRSIAATSDDPREHHVVPTITVDDIVARSKLDRLRMIKIDIEGAEEHALRGAARTLSSLKPIIVIEVQKGNAPWWAVPHPRVLQILDRLEHLLRSFGYGRLFLIPTANNVNDFVAAHPDNPLADPANAIASMTEARKQAVRLLGSEIEYKHGVFRHYMVTRSETS